MKYPFFLKKLVHNSKYALNRLPHREFIQLDWYAGNNNFGDILNPFIVGQFSTKKILNVRSRYVTSDHLLAIGSIIDRATSHSIIWGSGLQTDTSIFISRPKKVCAVRGPHTRDKLVKAGVACPEIYGDPALLLPRYYKPKVNRRYALGVIPHYKDKDAPWLKSLPEDVLLIDIQNPKPLEVIDNLCSCDMVASTSLHGLIVTDAYGIPNLWISLSDRLTSANFKYQDYFASIGMEPQKCFEVKPDTPLEEVKSRCATRKLRIDLDLLEASFPEEFL
jgi:pyruvyltransferase